MTKSEEEIVRGAIRRLRGERATDKVRAALEGDCRLYINTWVIGALETLLPESRDIDLGKRMSR